MNQFGPALSLLFARTPLRNPSPQYARKRRVVKSPAVRCLEIRQRGVVMVVGGVLVEVKPMGGFVVEEGWWSRVL